MDNTLAGDVANWATPQHHDKAKGDADRVGRFGTSAGGRNLTDEVAQWSTPCASASANRTLKQTPSNAAGKHGGHLTAEVLNWGTPKSRDSKTPLLKATFDRRIGESKRGLDLNEQVAETDGRGDHRLSPDWEETLLGWPIGWTDPSVACAGDFPGFPMGQGYEQYAYEPARTVHKTAAAGRTKRIGMIGNGVCPQQAEAAFYFLLTDGAA